MVVFETKKLSNLNSRKIRVAENLQIFTLLTKNLKKGGKDTNFTKFFFHTGIFTSSSTYPFTFRNLQISRIVKYWLGPALVLMMEWPDTCSLLKFSATIEQ